MTQDRMPVRGKRPPAPVLAVVNPLMRALLRSRLGRRMDPSMALLLFTGRRSGRRFAVPVGVHEVDGRPTVFTAGRWRRNFAGGHPVDVLRGGRVSSGRGDLIEAAHEVGAGLHAALRRVPARRLGIAVAPGHQPTADDLGAVGQSMIRLHLDEG
jgi:hypothetical protein